MCCYLCNLSSLPVVYALYFCNYLGLNRETVRIILPHIPKYCHVFKDVVCHHQQMRYLCNFLNHFSYFMQLICDVFLRITFFPSVVYLLPWKTNQFLLVVTWPEISKIFKISVSNAKLRFSNYKLLQYENCIKILLLTLTFIRRYSLIIVRFMLLERSDPR